MTGIDCEAVSAAFHRFHEETGGDTASAAMLTLGAILASRSTEGDGVRPEEAPLTVVEAAGAMKVSKDAVYDLCDSGRLRHHRIGSGRGTIRIMPKDIDDLRRAGTSPLADSAKLRHYRPRR
jgi:excisionase family DNA binding protein